MITKGQTTIKTMTSMKAKEDVHAELESRLKKTRRDEHSMNKMADLTAHLLVNTVINIFQVLSYLPSASDRPATARPCSPGVQQQKSHSLSFCRCGN
jgi:hypothetical protein